MNLQFCQIHFLGSYSPAFFQNFNNLKTMSELNIGIQPKYFTHQLMLIREALYFNQMKNIHLASAKTIHFKNDEDHNLNRKVEESPSKPHDPTFNIDLNHSSVESFSNQLFSEKCIKSEIDKILAFLLTNMGKKNQTEIEAFINSYHNPHLQQVYNRLVMKYFSVKKTTEDSLRYILRKVFKVLKASIMNKDKVSSKQATIILCKKYFQKSLDRIQQSQGHIQNDDELLELFMPYNKKSQNKTMNSSFLAEIFSSEEFCQEYELFLSKFSNILRTDNMRKKEKLSRFIMECMKSNSISKIGTFTRFPWLEVWVEDTINMAMNLLQNKVCITQKKLKY